MDWQNFSLFQYTCIHSQHQSIKNMYHNKITLTTHDLRVDKGRKNPQDKNELVNFFFKMWFVLLFWWELQCEENNLYFLHPRKDYSDLSKVGSSWFGTLLRYILLDLNYFFTVVWPGTNAQHFPEQFFEAIQNSFWISDTRLNVYIKLYNTCWNC
jgi:hypothetical protein